MKNEDPALTYEELTALCKKQEEHIKELEEELNSDSECDEEPEPTYDALCRKIGSLHYQLKEMKNENSALRWALAKAYELMGIHEKCSEMWQEQYYEETEKLYEQLDEKNKEDENERH